MRLLESPLHRGGRLVLQDHRVKTAFSLQLRFLVRVLFLGDFLANRVDLLLGVAVRSFLQPLDLAFDVAPLAVVNFRQRGVDVFLNGLRRARQPSQRRVVEGAALDAEMAGGAAVVARHVLEPAVVDRQVRQPHLLDLRRRLEGVEDGQPAELVAELPALLRRHLGEAIEAGRQLFQIFLGLVDLLLRRRQRLHHVLVELLVDAVQFILRLGEPGLQILHFVVELLRF